MILKPFLRESMIPLPVAMISTVSADGIRNIAPYSCIMPVLRPLDLMCIATARRRHTLDNIRDTGEFVINLPGAELADRVIPTAKISGPEVDEFTAADLEEKPSTVISAPGIRDCYAWMECRLHKLYEESNYILIMGKVLHLEADDRFVNPDGSLDTAKARPLMMTGTPEGMNYCTATDLGIQDPFAAMFPDGRDPMEKMYKKETL